MWASINGALVLERDAVVSVRDRGFRYGDGVFETLRVYNGRAFLSEAHVNRLLRSADVLGIAALPGRQELLTALGELVGRNGLRDALVQIIATRGVSEGWEPSEKTIPTVVMTEKHTLGYPEAIYTTGASVIITAATRLPPSVLDPTIKSLNRLPQIQAKREATARGADEAIVCTETGLVAEGSVSNVFCVNAGRILTPPESMGLLPGITRRVVIDLARGEGMSCEEAVLTREQLDTAEEVFLTSTGMEVLPVTRVDDRPISTGRPGTISLALRRLYQEFVRSRLPESQPR